MRIFFFLLSLFDSILFLQGRKGKKKRDSALKSDIGVGGKRTKKIALQRVTVSPICGLCTKGNEFCGAEKSQ